MSIDAISQFLTQLGDLSPAAFCCAILLGLNLLMRRSPIPNWCIPWISVIVGMILFPVFLPVATNFKNPLGRNIGMGFIIGLIAAVGYSAIVAFGEKKWPWLHDVLNPDIQKPKPKEPPTDKPPTT